MEVARDKLLVGVVVESQTELEFSSDGHSFALLELLAGDIEVSLRVHQQAITNLFGVSQLEADFANSDDIAADHKVEGHGTQMASSFEELIRGILLRVLPLKLGSEGSRGAVVG